MDVSEAIRRRRAYRSLTAFAVTDELLVDLAEHVRLAPSCFNNQPWRLVFCRAPERLARLHEALSGGNAWAKAAPLAVAICSQRDLDCKTGGRDYYLFDCGIAAAFLVLRATELGLVAHPIAGYDEAKAKEALGVPADLQLISLIFVGRKSESLGQLLSPAQAAREAERPPRKELSEFAFVDQFGTPLPYAQM
jgi:nitroreductase